MTTIYYFTGTGNCYMAARMLADILGEETRLIQITNDAAQGTDLSGCTGIVFPVYYAGVPKIVEKFLVNANVNPTAYFFAVATMGNLSGNALLTVSHLLQKKGCTLQAGYEIKMPENYAPMFDALALDKQKLLFALAKSKSEQIASDIRQKRCTKLPGFNPVYHLYHSISCLSMEQKDKKFTVDMRNPRSSSTRILYPTNT